MKEFIKKQWFKIAILGMSVITLIPLSVIAGRLKTSNQGHYLSSAKISGIIANFNDKIFIKQLLTYNCDSDTQHGYMANFISTDYTILTNDKSICDFTWTISFKGAVYGHTLKAEVDCEYYNGDITFFVVTNNIHW